CLSVSRIRLPPSSTLLPYTTLFRSWIRMLPGRGARAREGTRNDDPSCHIGATPAPFGPVTCDTVGPGGPHGCRREPVVGTPGESSYHGRMPSPQPNESGAGPWQATDPAAPAPVRAREDIDPRGRS